MFGQNRLTCHEHIRIRNTDIVAHPFKERKQLFRIISDYSVKLMISANPSADLQKLDLEHLLRRHLH